MDGKGRCLDNVFIERLRRSLKYEEVYLAAYQDVTRARAGIDRWLRYYNFERSHQSLSNRKPMDVYRTRIIAKAAA
ncbi:MAG: transposase [Deltaproteobacteria bacterium]|nr:transposase [Deltaproteobacteria bacterium]